MKAAFIISAYDDLVLVVPPDDAILARAPPSGKEKAGSKDQKRNNSGSHTPISESVVTAQTDRPLRPFVRRIGETVPVEIGVTEGPLLVADVLRGDEVVEITTGIPGIRGTVLNRFNDSVDIITPDSRSRCLMIVNALAYGIDGAPVDVVPVDARPGEGNLVPPELQIDRGGTYFLKLEILHFDK